ncbi:LOW QUALITY PROTEIN: 9,11-endoperoxide prostaglandin H2 reductase-like [Acropora millepora]|uniref:LOW QUALITY PROTEIN: 9,11-endoperoxide prostaglandin H2 reductase-like n=1 Tax=Acropora millepora TaxID=45264 RepID=UPI001CF5F2E3|nr:LOW QUALITY PROTEIN: 9,11-endoperoxide prostaglandin H2 reductase-like [Acropora millepora]
MAFCASLRCVSSVQTLATRGAKKSRFAIQAWKLRQNCELITSKDNYANFYTSSLQLNIMNISSTLTLNDGVKIPIFGLGVYQASAGEETRRSVTWALEKGYRQIDTAARYMNEESVGQAIRNSKIQRENVFVVTKLYDDDHGFDETLKAFNDSLGKLGLEYVDLYLMHSPVPDKVLPSWNAMVKLQQQGLIRSIGVSNFGIHHLEELKKHSNVIPSINQIEVHPFLQESDVVNYCRKEGIVVQAYSPLTRGKKLGHPSLTSIGNNHGKTTAQILLRWCVQSGYVCIPKSSRLSRIEENASIFDFHLSEEEMAILNGLEEGFRTCRPKIQAPWNG